MSSRSSSEEKSKTNTEKLKKRAPEDSDSDDEGEKKRNKWKYLEHHCFFFPEQWKTHGIPILYNGEEFELNAFQEEICTYWAQSIGTDWETKDFYKNNFKQMFMETLKDDTKKFSSFDFSRLQAYLEVEREAKKNLTGEQKKLKKEEKDVRDAFFTTALIDNFTEKLSGYTIEAPTLFKGRGDHPRAGFLKTRILPEDVIINIAEDAPVPKCSSMPGHCWKDIVHDENVTWLASYKDDTIKKDNIKYLFLAANSKFKGESDLRKYEKARNLKSIAPKIRDLYMVLLTEKSRFDRQIGTATYLIDKLALRVGNEKSEEEADTVGTCSLRVEHIIIHEDVFNITLNFLGKDSMRYENTVEVDEKVYNNLKMFVKDKNPEDNLFEQINAARLNDYLHTLMEGLTGKVFRTFNASDTLQKQQDQYLTANKNKENVESKVSFYDESNKQVAILCNHQKTVTKQYEASKEKAQEKIEDIESYLKELKEHLNSIKKNKAGKKDQEPSEKGRIPRRFPPAVDKTKLQIEKIEERISKEKTKLDDREDKKGIALGTSKTNYNDPRITIAWCKKNEVPIERVFSKDLRNKFAWAMNTEPLWKF